MVSTKTRTEKHGAPAHHARRSNTIPQGPLKPPFRCAMTDEKINGKAIKRFGSHLHPLQLTSDVISGSRSLQHKTLHLHGKRSCSLFGDAISYAAIWKVRSSNIDMTKDLIFRQQVQITSRALLHSLPRLCGGYLMGKARHLPHYVQGLKTAGTLPPVPHTTTFTSTLYTSLHSFIIQNKHVYSREQL